MATIFILMEFSEKHIYVHIFTILNDRNTTFSGMINIKILFTGWVIFLDLILFWLPW